MSFADLVIQNGQIITMDPLRKIVEAVAVKGGNIILVGNKLEVKRLIGPMTEVIELDGRACTPGLVNTHDHSLEHGISSAFIVDTLEGKLRFNTFPVKSSKSSFLKAWLTSARAPQTKICSM